MSLKPGQRPRNTRGQPYHILAVRPLTEADLPALREKSAPLARLAALRDSHHAVARLMATGLTNIQIAAQTGHSLASISRYRRDPSMVELVAHYRALITSEWLDEVDQFQRDWRVVATKALRTINDHFDDAEERGDLVPYNRAQSTLSDYGDRFGYGKKSATVNVSVNYAAELEAAIARTKSKTLEAE